MTPPHNRRQRRRSRKGADRVLSAAIVIGIAIGFVYVGRQLLQHPDSTENLVLAAVLAIAAAAFILTLPGTQARLDRRAHERHLEQQRRFWREREERERLQRLAQERKDAERAERRQARAQTAQTAQQAAEPRPEDTQTVTPYK